MLSLFRLFRREPQLLPLKKQCIDIWKLFRDDPTFMNSLEKDRQQLGIESVNINNDNYPTINGLTNNKTQFTCAPDYPIDTITPEPILTINCICNNASGTDQVNIKKIIFEDARKLNENFLTLIYERAYPNIIQGNYTTDNLVKDLQDTYWEPKIEPLKTLLIEDIGIEDKILSLKEASDTYQSYSKLFLADKERNFEILREFINNYELPFDTNTIDRIARFRNYDFPLIPLTIDQPAEGV